jgi:Asp-tRNA(Asn)/Glu-tRNA(Gln) amidotransferase A subunit family amidase
MTEPFRLTAAEAARRIAAGELSSETLVRSCLGRIDEREPEIRAWASVDPRQAIAEAREIDTRLRQSPGSVGPLAGVPVGVKDVIDAEGHPTRFNSRAYRGRQAAADAPCVALLRAAGAVVLGKTETVEFAAHGRHAVTRNPHDPDRTPGGSSSGSAAAVAEAMVPLALGTQTGGSVIRPASFCGIFGFKPTHGVVSLEGVSCFAPTLDTLGWHARSAEDLALLAAVYAVSDGPTPAVPAPATLRIGVCRTPEWERAEAASRDALARAADRLAKAGAQVAPAELPESFRRMNELKDVVMRGEGAASFRVLVASYPHLVSPGLRKLVEGGPTQATLRDALDEAAALRPVFDAFCRDYDALLTPSSTGEAPDTKTTGDAVFNGLWTLLHAPCATIPGLIGPNRLPVGVQLVGPRYGDALLLAATQAVAGVIGG